MNKYVLIPHDQYLRFKAFVAENIDSTYTQIEQQAVDDNKSGKSKGKSEDKLQNQTEK